MDFEGLFPFYKETNSDSAFPAFIHEPHLVCSLQNVSLALRAKGSNASPGKSFFSINSPDKTRMGAGDWLNDQPAFEVPYIHTYVGVCLCICVY